MVRLTYRRPEQVYQIKEQFDLVVMGTIARTGLKGALIGNAAETGSRATDKRINSRMIESSVVSSLLH